MFDEQFANRPSVLCNNGKCIHRACKTLHVPLTPNYYQAIQARINEVPRRISGVYACIIFSKCCTFSFNDVQHVNNQ